MLLSRSDTLRDDGFRRRRAELTGRARATGFERAGHSEKMSDGARLARNGQMRSEPLRAKAGS
jgi:hypothetical protein